MDHLFVKDLFITSPQPRSHQALDNFLGKVDGSPTRRRRIAGLCCDFGRPIKPFEPEQHIVFPAQKVKSHGNPECNMFALLRGSGYLVTGYM